MKKSISSALIISLLGSSSLLLAAQTYQYYGACSKTTHEFFGTYFNTYKECRAAAKLHKEEYKHDAGCLKSGKKSVSETDNE